MFPTPKFTNNEILVGYKEGIFTFLGTGGLNYFNVEYKDRLVPAMFEFNNGEIVIQVNTLTPVVITDITEFKKTMKKTLQKILNVGNIILPIDYDHDAYPDYLGTYTKMLQPTVDQPNKIIFECNNSGDTDTQIPVRVEMNIDILKRYNDISYFMLVFQKINS